MRRLLFLGLGGALLFTFGVGPAQADNGPHVASAGGVGFNQVAGSDTCATCHRVHTTLVGLAQTASRDDVCLTCHGPSAGGATTDVLDGVGYEAGGTENSVGRQTPGALRGGGFNASVIGSGAATKEEYRQGASLLSRNQTIPVLAAAKVATSKHSVTSATETAWDRSPLNPAAGDTVAMECVSCHDPHGNGSYRILRQLPAGAGASPDVVDVGLGVAIPDAGVKVYTTVNYWLSGDAGVPPVTNTVNGVTAVRDGYAGNVVSWCTTCHQRNHFDQTIKMTGTSCITCHVAHGSNATMNVAGSNPTQLADGSAVPSRGNLLRVDTIRAICVMCHER